MWFFKSTSCNGLPWLCPPTNSIDILCLRTCVRIAFGRYRSDTSTHKRKLVFAIPTSKRISSASYAHSIRCTTELSAEVSTSRREVIQSYICPGQEPASYVVSLLSARRGGEDCLRARSRGDWPRCCRQYYDNTLLQYSADRTHCSCIANCLPPALS